ncbi:MAG: sensor histidine kinase [Zoogloeaceae bacterium]|nr:sensor histidine kinase [Zoogloeaceae bacterium]
MTFFSLRGGRRHRGLLAALLALIACTVTALLAYRSTLDAGIATERDAATHRLAFYAQTLEASLTRYESLPGLLALERDLTQVLANPDQRTQQAANTYLEAAQQAAGVAAAYLMDINGNTLAASNWQKPGSFVGQNYGFRPYFREAIDGGTGRFYAIGSTTGEPGYFLSAPMRQQGRIVGVIAIKVALEGFEQALINSGDMALLVDGDGIAFLTSNPAWRYHALAPLTPAVRSELAETRKYGSREPAPLLAGNGIAAGKDSVRLLEDGKARELIWHAHRVGPLGWQLVLLNDPTAQRNEAVIAGAAAAFASAFLLTLAIIQRLRRRRREELKRLHAELELRIAERTDDLSRQIEALERTKAILHETQDAAVQAGKLAVLGQMSAGMTHELNQPLAALHAYSDNAMALLDRGRTEEVRDNLASISHLAGRLGHIVGQLKSFARKAPAQPTAVAVDSVLANALLIIEPRRRELAAGIDTTGVTAGLQVRAEAVRLEQVLVNLLRNGLDAAAAVSVPQLEIDARCEGEDVRITVRDNGSGLPASTLAHLFEPFYTTKSAGEGLGLGLAISLTIVESLGGRIEAANRNQGQGAEFSVLLPVAPQAPMPRPDYRKDEL